MLGTRKQELDACRKRFKGVHIGDFGWFIHHAIMLEAFSEEPAARIKHILDEKPKYQQARRLHEMRPVTAALPIELDKACAEWGKARAEWDKEIIAAHLVDVPDTEYELMRDF
jgi:hypothetical protein